MRVRTGTHTTALGVLMVAVVLATQAPAQSQVIIDGQTAFENASAGSIAARAPGNMVNAGLARAQDFANNAAAGVQITETGHPTSIWAQALADSITIILDQVNLAILFVRNQLLLRAGDTAAVDVSNFINEANSGEETESPEAETETESERDDIADRFPDREPKKAMKR